VSLELRNLSAEGKSGVEALRNGRRIARLVAALREDDVRGRHSWTDLVDHDVAEGEDPGLYRQLYAAAAPEWVKGGYLDHYVVVQADRDVLDAWYSLSFAQQQVHGERALTGQPDVTPEGFTVRRGGGQDLGIAMRLAYVIFDHQSVGPTWAGAPAPPEEEARASYAEYLADPKVTYFVAERDGEPLGHLAIERESDESVYLDIAATLPEARGLGVGSALTHAALAWAWEHGYRRCATDWRSANLVAARFWTGQGFKPTAYRLSRSVRVVSR